MIQYQDQHTIVFESALFRTTSTLIRTPDLLLLVDPNWLPREIEQIQKAVAEWGRGLPLFLLFTHSDYDHIIGYGAFPEAKVIASAAFVANPDAEKQLAEIRKFDDAYYIQRNYPIEYPVVDHVVEGDGQELIVGATRLTFYLAPGHNPDGIFTLVEPLGIWLAGDYLSNIEFPYIYESSTKYLQTLEKAERIVQQFPLHLMVPGHGDATGDVPEIRRRCTESEQYIRRLLLAIREGKDFPVAELWTKYAFPGVMARFHAANVALLRQEIGM